MPSNPHQLYEPMPGFPGAEDHGSSWAPAQFPVELSQTSFVRQAVTDWLEAHGDEPFFVHASFIRPHPPRRNPIGYHDLYDAEAVTGFVGCATREEEAAIHPLGARGHGDARRRAHRSDERDRRQLRATYYGAQREVDDGLGQLFDYLAQSGLADSTLIVLTSDHGEMGGDHWLLEKLGYWDESYHVPLIVVDPRPEADASRGRVVDAVTESVDILPTICATSWAPRSRCRPMAGPWHPSCTTSPRPNTGATRRTSNGPSPTRCTAWPSRASASR